MEEKKASFKNLTILLLAIFLVAGGGGGYLIAYNDYQPKIDEYEERVADLMLEVSTLTSTVSRLEEDNYNYLSQVSYLEALTRENEEEIDELQDEVSKLKVEKNNLESSLKSKEIQLSSLQSSYNTIRGDYDSLKLEYELERELRIGNSLESYYDGLREGLGPTGARYWWFDPEKHIWQTQVDFAASLALHDLWRIYWPAYETDYEELTGENSYETAYNKLTNIVSYVDIYGYDSSTEKISKILSFLNENVHYETEVNDIFLAPVETLGYKSGDCDDYSILAAALFEYVGVESAIGFFRNDEDEYHAMVLVHLDELEGYYYWYYEDLTDLGLDEGQWIKIEPQRTIEYQGDDWIGQWNILAAEQLEDENT